VVTIKEIDLKMTTITESYKVNEFINFIHSSKKITIISHINPDGDSVGSTVAMYRFLTQYLNKEVNILMPNSYPEYLSFLDQEKRIIICDKTRDKAQLQLERSQLIICMDFNHLSRVELITNLIEKSKAKKILIDHHPNPQEEVFDLTISDVFASSTCELTFFIIKKVLESSDFNSISQSGSKLSTTVAEALYVGLMTDTNNFSNSVRWETFFMACELMKTGIDKENIQNIVFASFSLDRMRLMGHLLSNKMIVYPQYNAAILLLSKKDQKRYNLKDGDSEGFVNMPLQISGINISALFTEKEDYIRVSFRSNNNFSVNMLSRLHYHGAGHERAAGGKISIPMKNVAQFFEDSLRQSYNECFNTK
jgi:phosphoesterase RecJ-like protein